MTPFARLLLAAALIGSASSTLAQARFGIGYSGSWYLRSLRNLEVEAFSLNAIHHPYWDRKLEPSRFSHGLNFDLHIAIDDSWGIFFYWKNHHNIFEGGGVNPATGFDEKIELKVRLNTFGLLGFEAFSERVRFAFSIDFGTAKIFQRYAMAEDPDPKWELYYAKNSGILGSYQVFGSSVFLHYSVAKRIRFSLQWFHDWFGINPFDKDESGTQYFYRFSNLSCGVQFDLGKLD